MMKSKMKVKKAKWTRFDIVVMFFSILACAITLYPMIYVFSCSISNPQMVTAGRVTFLPVGFSADAYRIVLADDTFWRSLFNSIIYVIIGCVLMLFNTIAVSYPLTRPNLKFRKIATYYLLIPMYFGGGMIPTFIVVTKLGLYNSPLALILPACYSIWNIILCRTFMASLPNELIDSALMDGCDQIKTLLRIVMPLSKPVFAVILIYTIVGTWNSWFPASIYTTKKAIQPVQLYLKNLLTIASSQVNTEMLEGLSQEEIELIMKSAMSAGQIKYAVIVVVTIPIIAVYPMFQKHFTKGMMLGSLKG